jgi:hypothetical protein
MVKSMARLVLLVSVFGATLTVASDDIATLASKADYYHAKATQFQMLSSNLGGYFEQYRRLVDSDYEVSAQSFIELSNMFISGWELVDDGEGLPFPVLDTEKWLRTIRVLDAKIALHFEGVEESSQVHRMVSNADSLYDYSAILFRDIVSLVNAKKEFFLKARAACLTKIQEIEDDRAVTWLSNRVSTIWDTNKKNSANGKIHSALHRLNSTATGIEKIIRNVLFVYPELGEETPLVLERLGEVCSQKILIKRATPQADPVQSQQASGSRDVEPEPGPEPEIAPAWPLKRKN